MLHGNRPNSVLIKTPIPISLSPYTLSLSPSLSLPLSLSLYLAPSISLPLSPPISLPLSPPVPLSLSLCLWGSVLWDAELHTAPCFRLWGFLGFHGNTLTGRCQSPPSAYIYRVCECVHVCICVYMCVSVCTGERERASERSERERAREKRKRAREREAKERARERESLSSRLNIHKLLHYSLYQQQDCCLHQQPHTL